MEKNRVPGEVQATWGRHLEEWLTMSCLGQRTADWVEAALGNRKFGRVRTQVFSCQDSKGQHGSTAKWNEPWGTATATATNLLS